MVEIDTGVWHEDLFGVLLFGVVLISVTLLLIISINTWKGKDIKRRSLLYLLIGVLILVFTILYWVFEFDPSWETIGFTTIGLFISGAISILAFIIDRSNTNRSGKSTPQ